ncbi:MAG: argininosuccinate lyase [Candidatus Omnitrophota bacterium]
MKKAKLWGGRFGKGINPWVEEWTRSIHYDYKLAECDMLGSMLQAEVLAEAGYLTRCEAGRLVSALRRMRDDAAKGRLDYDPGAEDIHTYIQNTLEKKVGNLALKLQTARSRNEQVALSTRLYCIHSLRGLKDGGLREIILALEGLARGNGKMIIPGFTHLRRAQPVYLKDYLGAYARMFRRDSRRLRDIIRNIPLFMGAGALAGGPIAADKYIRVLKRYFGGQGLKIMPLANSLDAVSDRDFVLEALGALSILGMHISRLCEDLIVLSSQEFGFLEIDEAFCTGSSLMPQKKNPDVLELARGYSGRLYGNLIGVLTMMKGLPLTYNRDMQLDKEPLFSSLDIVSGELKVLTGLVKTLKFNRARISKHLKDESLYATDLAYYLVDKKVPFRQAHTIVGKLVKYSLDNGVLIKDMPQGLLNKFSSALVKKDIVRLFDPVVSVGSKRSIKRK